MKVDKRVTRLIESINRRSLTNNTQRVLLSLLTNRTKDGWVARTSIPVNSATARVRELRRPEFGSFVVECVPAEELRKMNPKRKVQSRRTGRQTFYRVVPSSVTLKALKRVFRV